MIPKVGLIYFSFGTSRRVLSIDTNITFFQRAEKTSIGVCSSEEFEKWFFSDGARHIIKPSSWLNEKDNNDIKELFNER